MKKITIDTRSWHYWFANLGDGANLNDFCAYVRSVIGGMLMCLVATIAIAFMSAVFGETLGWFLAWLLVGFTEPLTLAMGGAMLIGLSVTVLAIYFSLNGMKAAARENEFVLTAYKSLRDKICFKVEIQ